MTAKKDKKIYSGTGIKNLLSAAQKESMDDEQSITPESTTDPEQTAADPEKLAVATETNQKTVATEAEQVLDLKPTSTPEPIDSAVVDQNTETIRALTTNTKEQIETAATPELSAEHPFKVGDAIFYKGQKYQVLEVTEQGDVQISYPTIKEPDNKIVIDKRAVRLPPEAKTQASVIEPEPPETINDSVTAMAAVDSGTAKIIDKPPTATRPQPPKNLPIASKTKRGPKWFEKMMDQANEEGPKIKVGDTVLYSERKNEGVNRLPEKEYKVLEVTDTGDIRIAFPIPEDQNNKILIRKQAVRLPPEAESQTPEIVPEKPPITRSEAPKESTSIKRLTLTPEEMDELLGTGSHDNEESAAPESFTMEDLDAALAPETSPAPDKPSPIHLTEEEMADILAGFDESDAEEENPPASPEPNDHELLPDASEVPPIQDKPSSNHLNEEESSELGDIIRDLGGSDTGTENPPPFEQGLDWPEHPAKTERNTVIRNIANQGILRSRLMNEDLARGENPTEEKINELAKIQADFVKAKRVEKLIIKDSKKIKKIFKPEGTELTQDKLKQELLAALLDKKSLASQKKLRLLARQISNETGLDIDQAQELINNQEQHLRDSALAEINAGQAAGASTEEATANAKAGRKKKIGWALAKTTAYIGGGALLTGVTGGVGAIAALTGVRIIDRIITDRLQKKKVDAKFAEMKAQLEADPNQRDNFLQQFFTETAVSQQQRISGEHNFNFEGFAADNPDLLAGYETGEQEQIMKALGALQRIDQINYIRENDLLERLANKVKKTDNRALGFMERVATGFNKFMIKGGENTYERAISAAMLGGAAIAAREMPIIRNLMLAMAGWKTGDFAGRMIWGAEKTELGRVDDIDTAQDILDMMAVMEQNKTSDKHKRLLLKASTSLLFASAPFIANQILTHWPTHGAKGAENTILEKPTTAPAEAPIAIPTEAAASNPIDKTIADMENIHGRDSHHLWELIDKKVQTMSGGFKEGSGLEGLGQSEGRMANVIDTIKREIAKDPEKYGLAPDANIDLVTAADLERISQDPDFNDLIFNAFKPGSLVEHAQQLTPEAVSHIERANDFYQAAAQNIPKGVSLGQHDYDLMAQYQNQGLSSEAAARLITDEHLHTATNTIAQHAETAGLTHSAAETVAAGRETAMALENFQNFAAKSNWSRIFEGAGSQNKNLVGKSLDALFHRLGLADGYKADDLPYFQVENVLLRNGKIGFEIPAPAAASESLGHLKFLYDPGKHELIATLGKVQEVIKNVKDPDAAIKAAFQNIAKKL
ncbi:MAG: hypothetical protein WC517_01665 [Patescibacteria group bacterium]